MIVVENRFLLGDHKWKTVGEVHKLVDRAVHAVTSENYFYKTFGLSSGGAETIIFKSEYN